MESLIMGSTEKFNFSVRKNSIFRTEKSFSVREKLIFSYGKVIFRTNVFVGKMIFRTEKWFFRTETYFFRMKSHRRAVVGTITDCYRKTMFLYVSARNIFYASRNYIFPLNIIVSLRKLIFSMRAIRTFCTESIIVSVQKHTETQFSVSVMVPTTASATDFIRKNYILRTEKCIFRTETIVFSIRKKHILTYKHTFSVRKK